MLAAPLPTRFALPPEANGEPGGPPLEFVHWPLYSALALDAAAIPQVSELFNYLPGMLVSGAGTGAIAANQMHTNMTAIGAIPRPKTFVVTGIRVHVPPVAITSTVALSDDTTGAAVENNDQVDDLTAIATSCALRFRIGELTYAEGPILAMPANMGVGGVAATSVNANAASVWQTRVALHTCGLAWDFSTGRRPVLWSSQNFRVQLLCEWATNPTLLDNHLLYVYLDGILGRELQ